MLHTAVQRAVKFPCLVLWCVCQKLRSFVAVHSEKKGTLCTIFATFSSSRRNLYKPADLMSVCDTVTQKEWRLCYLNSEQFSLTFVWFTLSVWHYGFHWFRWVLLFISVPCFFCPLESVIPSSGTFHVKLPKKPGVELGITISCECLVFLPYTHQYTVLIRGPSTSGLLLL